MTRDFVLSAIETSLKTYLSAQASLTAVATGGVRRGTAPTSATYPYCSFHYYSSKIADWSFSALIRHPVIYVVKGISGEVAGQSDTEANAIAAVLGELMKDTPLTFPATPSWSALRCRVQQPISYDEGVAGQQFFHRGFQVGIDVQPV